MPAKSRPRGRPKSFHDKQSQNVIQSLDRALMVLDTLAGENGLGLSEISTQMGQSPATIYRVLTTLELRGFVEIDAASQSWNIGPTAFRLGSAFLRRSNVVERSRPVMRQLMEDTGETANLGIEKSDMVMFVSQVETDESIRAFFPPGTQSPMHASGIGKALLSCYSGPRIHDLLKRQPLQSFTERTITDPATLLGELADIRRRGFAFDNEEKADGMRCIAAAITNFYGEAVAGISVSGPSNRMRVQDVQEIGDLVKEAAKQVSFGLGATLEKDAVPIDTP